MNSKNDFKMFLKKEQEHPRLAVLQRFKEINRVMTDKFLNQKPRDQTFKNQRIPIDPKRKKEIKEDYSQKMISIMKEMQSPRKFNSPLQRRQYFMNRLADFNSSGGLAKTREAFMYGRPLNINK